MKNILTYFDNVMKFFLKTLFIIMFALLSCKNNKVFKKNHTIAGWNTLDKYLLKHKKFMSPPSNVLIFQKKGILLSEGNTTKKTFRKTGKWYIDKKKGYIYIKKAYPYIKGYFEQTYKSFQFNCKNKKRCQLILHTKKIFKMPKNTHEAFGTADFLYLSPIEGVK